jgi:hypothetical protein
MPPLEGFSYAKPGRTTQENTRRTNFLAFLPRLTSRRPQVRTLHYHHSEVGSAETQFNPGLVGGRIESETGIRRVLGMHSLIKKYGAAAVEDACATALDIGVQEYASCAVTWSAVRTRKCFCARSIP